MSVPSIFEIQHIWASEDDAVRFLLENEILTPPQICAHCGGHVDRVKLKVYRCTSKGCRVGVSLVENTFFGTAKLPVNKILYLGYLWLLDVPHGAIQVMTGVSSATVTNWAMYFSDLVGLDIEEHHEMIGGPGIEVEIDESKFGKRRAHRGHRVDGVWVVGAVERTEERRMFAVQVRDRTEPTLTALIQRHIHPGSQILSDCWAGYSTNILEGLGYVHRTVNQKKKGGSGSPILKVLPL